MIQIPTRVRAAVDRGSVLSINGCKAKGPVNRQTIGRQPERANVSSGPAQWTGSAEGASAHLPNGGGQQERKIMAGAIPALKRTVRKGQKFPLQLNGSAAVQACFGWHVSDARCDVDVSAFLLGEDGRVLGDDWFVFYGQPASPDRSVRWRLSDGQDREIIEIDLDKIDAGVARVVFVLTINEALTQKLNFGMLRDTYVRILQRYDGAELVSFQMEEYYDNVISMMIGELYRHQGAWKFYAVGNGMARDLAGICQFYGVEVSG